MNLAETVKKYGITFTLQQVPFSNHDIHDAITEIDTELEKYQLRDSHLDEGSWKREMWLESAKRNLRTLGIKANFPDFQMTDEEIDAEWEELYSQD